MTQTTAEPETGIEPGERNFEDLAGYQLRRVGELVRRELAEIFSEIGLAPGQFSILMLIAANPGCSQNYLAAKARLDRSTLVPVIRRLLALGLIRRERRTDDRRAYSLAVTQAGRRAVKRIAPRTEALERVLNSNLDANERAVLVRALRKVEDAILAGRG